MITGMHPLQGLHHRNALAIAILPKNEEGLFPRLLVKLLQTNQVNTTSVFQLPTYACPGSFKIGLQMINM
jgi:hypothetical protein